MAINIEKLLKKHADTLSKSAMHLGRPPKSPATKARQEEPRQRFGQIIHKARIAAGYTTLSSAAREAGISAQRLAQLEAGKARPTGELVLRLAPVLGFSTDELGMNAIAAIDPDLHRALQTKTSDAPAVDRKNRSR